MFVLRLLRKSFRVLTADVAPSEIAAGVVLGMFLGLSPFNLFNTLLVLLVVLLFRVNIGILFVSLAAFSGLAYLVAPLLHRIGYFLLVDVSFLAPLWGYLVSLPLVPLTGFNNTLMMGGFCVWVVLVVPVFIGVRKGVEVSRAKLSERFRRGRVGLILRVAGWLGLLGRTGPS